MQVMQILKDKGADVVTMFADETIAEAARVLRERRIGAVVVTGPRGELQGILSERDVVRCLAQRGADVMEDRVGSVMTSPVITCEPDTSLEDLMRLMTHRRIRHLPVVRGGRLAGIISIGDVVRFRLMELESETETLREYIGGR
ncbi:MAG TPA: CBS domain-containing protein [Alphaproteobacteria bacterium]|nr:CBS domain-containing protein [Alphaproteobacteria bacterium]